jgi:hypothetical protein
MLAAAETERRRVERDLHDGAQQRLLALRVHLRLADGAGEPSTFDYADREIAAAVEELRDLVHGIHPAVLRELSLASALRSLGARSAIPVTFSHLPQERLPEPVQEAVYYIVAEALANAQKHSRASSIRVRVAAEDGHVLAEASDNGVGGASETDGSGAARAARARSRPRGNVHGLEPARPRHEADRRPPGRVIRVVHGEDNLLIREGVSRILARAADSSWSAQRKTSTVCARSSRSFSPTSC